MWKWSWSPHKRWGGKHVDALKGPMGNPKGLGPRISQKHAWRLSRKKWACTKWAYVKRPIKEGNNGANKKVYGQNINKRSQMQLGHPLTSKTPFRDEHICLMHLAQKKK